MKHPKCGFDNPDKTKFCNECGKVNLPGSRFCIVCRNFPDIL